MTDPNAALEFARRHDWGADAKLSYDLSGDPYIIGLRDEYLQFGEKCCDVVSVRASIPELRAFGGY